MLVILNDVSTLIIIGLILYSMSHSGHWINPLLAMVWTVLLLCFPEILAPFCTLAVGVLLAQALVRRWQASRDPAPVISKVIVPAFKTVRHLLEARPTMQIPAKTGYWESLSKLKSRDNIAAMLKRPRS